MFDAIPSTIRDPARFFQQLPAGFDGPFDWEYLRGAFPRSIMPMDFDGVVEINHFCLQFETKGNGNVEIPTGQARTIQTIRDHGNWSVFLIWGKSEPTRWQFHTPIVSGGLTFPHRIITNSSWPAKQAIKEIAARWAAFVDSREAGAWILAQTGAHEYFLHGKPIHVPLRRRDGCLL